MLCIKVDVVGYPGEYVAMSDSAILGCSGDDAVASEGNHGLEVSGRIERAFIGVLGSVSCAGEHREAVTETVEIVRPAA